MNLELDRALLTRDNALLHNEFVHADNMCGRLDGLVSDMEDRLHNVNHTNFHLG